MKKTSTGSPPKTLVSLRVIGGLGNQLFQFAHAFSLANRSGAHVNLDTSSFKRYGGHEGFLLDELLRSSSKQLAGVELKRRDISSLLSNAVRFGPTWKPLMEWIFRTRIFWEQRAFEYRHFDLTPGKEHLFVGFWQSWRFFEADLLAIRAALRKWLDIDRIRATLRERLKVDPKTTLVMVHVRRGDYLIHGDTYTYLGKEYYSSALSHVLETETEPVFVIFTDEPKRVQIEGIFPDEVKYFDDRGMTSTEILANMAACDYFVTANSTFSWWAAFIGSSMEDNRRVCAPSQWLKAGDSTSELLFENWKQITPDGALIL